MVPEGVTGDGLQVTEKDIIKTGVKTRQVVLAGGSMLLNETQRNQVLPMGYDRYSGMQFSNRDFIANAVLWLTDSEGLISLREKSVALRLLNDRRAHQERLKVQLVSTISPVAVLLLIGCLVWIIRKWKYEK